MCLTGEKLMTCMERDSEGQSFLVISWKFLEEDPGLTQNVREGLSPICLVEIYQLPLKGLACGLPNGELNSFLQALRNQTANWQYSKTNGSVSLTLYSF